MDSNWEAFFVGEDAAKNVVILRKAHWKGGENGCIVQSYEYIIRARSLETAAFMHGVKKLYVYL